MISNKNFNDQYTYLACRLVWDMDNTTEDYTLNGRELLEDEDIFESDDYKATLLAMDDQIKADEPRISRYRDYGAKRILVEYRLEKCATDPFDINQYVVEDVDTYEQCYVFTEEGVKSVKHRG